ncbi:MAG: hypothetical protein JO202_06170 [Ktedonobacteraceae bacterium]|nr:hypothetical protein [Ktedonobacteraceae bacterium]
MTQANVTRSGEGQTAQALHSLLIGYRSARALYVAVKFGIADLLKKGSKSVTELAQATGTHAPSLTRLLRATAALGVFEEVAPAVFAQSERSAYFCTDHPSGMYYMALLLGSDCEIAAMHGLEYAIQTGQPAFDHIHGMTYWTYLAHHPQYEDIFQRATAAYSFIDNEAILQAYDFSAVRTLIDGGGGLGSFLLAVLNKYPSMHGILFDRPVVIAKAKTAIAQSNCADRYILQAGDLFTSVPPGADTYFLKQVLHCWDDEHCLTILNTCRRSMQPHSKLLICEVVMSSVNIRMLDGLYDLTMLVRNPPEVHERTADEFRTLLTKAELHLSRIIPTVGRHSIIEATLREASVR